MSSLFTYELVILFAGILSFVALLFIGVKGLSKPDSKSKKALFFLLVPLVMIFYPINSIQKTNDNLEIMSQLNRELEAKPGQEEKKLLLKEKLAIISQRPIEDIEDLKELAKASYLTERYSKCLYYSEKVLDKKPFDEEAQRLATLSKTLED